MSNYEIAQLDQIDVIDDGREPFRPVRHHLGISAFGVNAWTGRQVGDQIINEHDEEGEDEELYIVHSGRARFVIDGTEVDAPTGSFVFVRPSARRTAFAEEPETTLVAVGAPPGEAYEPTGWELWAPLNKLYASGDYAEAADRGRELADANPQYGALLYNLACVESLAGRKDDALRDLGRAIERSDRARAFAAQDSDFDPIRDDPRFEELVAEKS